ncbi:hypothetical protein HYR54_07715 [Candidatus Acetothermia bacterium]|nr:hypothetical protein [Candidatus Acetothermia bacterium]
MTKENLLRAAFNHISTDLWEAGDGGRYSWVWTELEAIERKFDGLSKDELIRRLRLLYKRVAAAKGRRGHVTHRVKLNGFSVAEDTGQNTHSSASAKKNASAKGATMPVFVDVPNETLVGRGEHRAKIVAVGKPEQSKFDESKQSIKLTFEIMTGKFEGEKLTKHFTLSLSSKASLGQLYRRLKGEPKPGERVNIEDLIGQDVAIMVTHKDGDDGDYAVIQDVFAPDGAAVAVES